MFSSRAQFLYSVLQFPSHGRLTGELTPWLSQKHLSRPGTLTNDVERLDVCSYIRASADWKILCII